MSYHHISWCSMLPRLYTYLFTSSSLNLISLIFFPKNYIIMCYISYHHDVLNMYNVHVTLPFSLLVRNRQLVWYCVHISWRRVGICVSCCNYYCIYTVKRIVLNVANLCNVAMLCNVSVQSLFLYIVDQWYTASFCDFHASYIRKYFQIETVYNYLKMQQW